MLAHVTGHLQEPLLCYRGLITFVKLSLISDYRVPVARVRIFVFEVRFPLRDVVWPLHHGVTLVIARIPPVVAKVMKSYNKDTCMSICIRILKTGSRHP